MYQRSDDNLEAFETRYQMYQEKTEPIINHYKKIFNIDEQTAIKFAAITKGYALAFQAFGFLYWEYKDELPFEDILEKFDEILDDFAYRKIWENLSPTDKKIIGYFSEKEKVKVNDIRNELSITSAVFSKYREKLLNRGLLASKEYGTLELTLPRFGRFAKLMLAYEAE